MPNADKSHYGAKVNIIIISRANQIVRREEKMFN